MFFQIVRKEILESLLSVRFALSILFTIILFAASTFFFVERYREQSEDYWRRHNENLSGFREQTDQLCNIAFYEQHIYRKPKVLSLCASGAEQRLPGHFTFDGFDIGLPQIVGQSNFTLPRFGDLDWAWIISLVLSFTVFVFAYDCVCGEREKGTLRLILAGATPRATLLLAKYAGLILTLAIPLFLGLFISMIILIASGTESVGFIRWESVVVVVLTSFLYLSIFVFLGIFVSARTSNSSNSMAALLFIWVVLLLLIPSLGRVISDRFYHAATTEEFERAKSQARKSIDDRFYAGAYGSKASGTAPNRDDPDVDPPGRARYTVDETAAINRVVDAQYNRMLAQAEAGRAFIYISPAVVYRRICEVMAGTGIDRSKSLYRQIKRYQQNLREYILSEDQGDLGSLHLLFDDKARVTGWTTISHKSVNFDTVPKFQERDLGLGESLRLAVWDIGVLALFNLVFFAAAFVSFLRYDVR